MRGANRPVKSRPELSVIVPVRNAQDTILQTYVDLDRILMRWDRPYEILFVDDASDDRTCERLASLHGKDPALRLLRRTRRGGIPTAISDGLAQARGGTVAILDGTPGGRPGDLHAILTAIETGGDANRGWHRDPAGRDLVHA